METTILYITSFARDMYDASGKKLIASYLATQQEGDFLICYENMDETLLPSGNPKIQTYPLHQSAYLANWLNKNSAIIPARLGGIADEKLVPKLSHPANQKASRWFRKVASLHYAREIYGDKYQYLIWVDSDCEFKQNIPLTLIEQAFPGEKAMFYFQGELRRRGDYGYETGFVGFRKMRGEYELLQRWCDAYEGEFVNYTRWDDGYVLKIVCEGMTMRAPEFAEDLNKQTNPPTKNPLNVGNHLFSKYIIHYKGKHNKSKILV